MPGRIFFLFIAFVSFSCKKSAGVNSQTDPAISISDVNGFEGNTGTSTFEFEVTLDHPSTKIVTVSYSTQDGTATSGSDYTALLSQTLSFQPNETSKKISVNVIADDIEESDEQFSVILSNPTNASLGKSIGTATIRNDDSKVLFNDTGYDAPTSYTGYSLIWSDEFNGTSLDQSAWNYETGNNGWGNNELENYTSRVNNTTLQDGKLVIHALKENYSGSSYTSARITTQGKKEFTYGRIDIRAILPKGKGIWPALWMLGSNISTAGWPACGETDIMELLGQEPTKVYGTLHYGVLSNPGQKGDSYILPSGNFSDQFHVFSLEWKQDTVKIFVDNNLYLTVNKTDVGSYSYPFNASFFFIFNVAVGGNWPGDPDATTYFPQWMIVDYVRVYQQQ
ncbi:MAG: family 16 glycosylhydrolase [Chitinophagales bacterium]